jgi:hypothetical protein
LPSAVSKTLLDPVLLVAIRDVVYTLQTTIIRTEGDELQLPSPENNPDAPKKLLEAFGTILPRDRNEGYAFLQVVLALIVIVLALHLHETDRPELTPEQIQQIVEQVVEDVERSRPKTDETRAPEPKVKETSTEPHDDA